MVFTAEQIDRMSVEELFAPLPGLLGMRQEGALGYLCENPPIHWHANVSGYTLDCDISVIDCGYTERAAVFVRALMENAALDDGILLGLEQTRICTPENNFAEPLYFATAAKEGVKVAASADGPELALMRAYLKLKLGAY